MSYPFHVQFDRRGRGRGEGVGGGERSGPGGEGVGRGGRSGLGRKESAVSDWLVVRYVSLRPRFFIRFFKALSGDRTIPLQKVFNY